MVRFGLMGVRSILGGLAASLVLSGVGLQAEAAGGVDQIDFIALRTDHHDDGVERLSRALKGALDPGTVHVWSVASTGYRVAPHEIHVVYFDPAQRDLARATASVLADFANNSVCVVQKDDLSREGLGNVNVYLPLDLDLDSLAGGIGPADGYGSFPCMEARTVERAPEQLNVLTEVAGFRSFELPEY